MRNIPITLTTILAALLIALTATAGNHKDKKYSDARPLTDNESEMFDKIVKAAYTTASYKPFVVWTRTNKDQSTDYVFFSSRDDHMGHLEKCHIHILIPTIGEPLLKEIKRFK